MFSLGCRCRVLRWRAFAPLNSQYNSKLLALYLSISVFSDFTSTGKFLLTVSGLWLESIDRKSHGALHLQGYFLSWILLYMYMIGLCFVEICLLCWVAFVWHLLLILKKLSISVLITSWSKTKHVCRKWVLLNVFKVISGYHHININVFLQNVCLII